MMRGLKPQRVPTGHERSVPNDNIQGKIGSIEEIIEIQTPRLYKYQAHKT